MLQATAQTRVDRSSPPSLLENDQSQSWASRSTLWLVSKGVGWMDGRRLVEDFSLLSLLVLHDQKELRV